MECNPLSELLTSAAVGNLFTRCQRVVRKPIRYVTIHFEDRSGAASLRCKDRAEISDPFVNRRAIRYGFCVDSQAIRYSVDIALGDGDFSRMLIVMYVKPTLADEPLEVNSALKPIFSVIEDQCGGGQRSDVCCLRVV